MDRVERIQIGRRPDMPLLTIVKAKQGEDFSWRIPDLGNARADAKKIDELLSQLQKIAEEIKSERGGEATSLEGKGESFRVLLYDGNWNPLFALMMGQNEDPAGRHWVRQEGSASTHWTSVNLLSLLQGPWVEEDPSAV